MTNNESADYVTDVPYLRSFVKELSPTKLRLVAALNGFPQPPAEDFDYCELGSAHGDTTATLAAAYPRARFVGVDINPIHVASANRLATEGGLSNVRFLERDIADLHEDDLPKFDYITAHGVLSWIGPSKQQALLEFASAKLKPGGLLYVSYNALPGWAAVEPLRRLIRNHVQSISGTTLERAQEAIAFAKLMSGAGAEYFTSNPAATLMLETMEKHGLSYIVHEYLHMHWTPMYFADVAFAMAANDLYFTGQMPLHLNYRDLAIPATMTQLFQNVSDRIAFETLKDFALNQYFRCDVFVKGRVARADAETNSYFASTPFGTVLREAKIETNVRLPHHTLHFVGPIFDALFPALAEGVTTVEDLARRPELASFGIDRIRGAMLRLALVGQVSPMVKRTEAASVRADDEQTVYRIPSAYNRMLVEVLSGEHVIVLASEAAGTGVPLTILQAVALRLLLQPNPAARQAHLHELLKRNLFQVKLRDELVEDDEEKARVVWSELEQFRQKQLSSLLELGIIERVPLTSPITNLVSQKF